MTTLLLTGATGYIGSHNAVEFLQSGYDIVIMDNLSNSDTSSLDAIEQITGKKPIFYNSDLRDINSMREIFQNHTLDGVIHFAGLKAVGESCKEPLEYYDNNIVGTLNLISLMEEFGVKNIIFSSSATVYKPTEVPPFIEGTPSGETSNPYGTTKFVIEQLLRDMSIHKGFNVTNLRYFNPVGAHESGLIGEDPSDIPNNLLPYIMKVAAGELEILSIYGNDYDTIDGTGVRDYIHVVDLARAHLLAWKQIQSGNTGGNYNIYNLGTGRGSSVMEMIRYAQVACGKSIPHKIIGRRAGDIASAYCDPSLAESELGWKAEKTVEQAVADSWKFIQIKSRG